MCSQENLSSLRKRTRCASIEDPDQDTSSPKRARIDRPPIAIAQRLPAEILSEIFIHAIPSTYANYTTVFRPSGLYTHPFSITFPLNLAVICRAWHQVAMRTDALWASFYIELSDDSNEALSAFGRFFTNLLERFEKAHARTRELLKLGISFPGQHCSYFNVTETCDALRPLLKYQRYLESLEISFERQWNVRSGMRGLVLDLKELGSIKSLQLRGPAWGKRLGQYPGGIEVIPADYSPKIPSLVSLQYWNLQEDARTRLLRAAGNLQELEISYRVYECYRGQPIRLEKLKKLRIVDEQDVSNLGRTFDCPALEELSLKGIYDFKKRGLPKFIRTLRHSLRTLELSFWTYDCPTDQFDYTAWYQVLLANPELKFVSLSSEIGNMLDGEDILEMLILWKGEDAKYNCCPCLEELHLEGVLGSYAHFRQLVKSRWDTEERSIRKISFRNCKIKNEKHGPPHDKLLSIPGIKRCVKEGLEFDVSYDWYDGWMYDD